MSEKRFVPSKYAGHTHDVKTDKHYYVTDEYVGCRELFDEIENLEKENEQLQQKYDKLCIEMANIYSKYIFMKEFSEDTNPNEAVKYVLRELMQKTKGAR